jgi:hypothetical protein
LDHFRDSDNPVVAGLWPSRWRRPDPHIARGCIDCVRVEPAHRSQIYGVRQPKKPDLRGRQGLILPLLLFWAGWPSLWLWLGSFGAGDQASDGGDEKSGLNRPEKSRPAKPKIATVRNADVDRQKTGNGAVNRASVGQTRKSSVQATIVVQPVLSESAAGTPSYERMP